MLRGPRQSYKLAAPLLYDIPIECFFLFRWWGWKVCVCSGPRQSDKLADRSLI